MASAKFGSLAALAILTTARGALYALFSVALPFLVANLELAAWLSVGFVLVGGPLTAFAALQSATLRRDSLRWLGARLSLAFEGCDRQFYTVGDALTRYSDAQAIVTAAIQFCHEAIFALAVLTGTLAYLFFIDPLLSLMLASVLLFLGTLSLPIFDRMRALIYRSRLIAARLTDAVRAMWEQAADVSQKTVWDKSIAIGFEQEIVAIPLLVMFAQLSTITLLVVVVFALRDGWSSRGSLSILSIATVTTYLSWSFANLFEKLFRWQTLQVSVRRLQDFVNDHA